MTKEDFFNTVKKFDAKQGHYELTIAFDKALPNSRYEAIMKYPNVAIAFYDWAIQRGERVFVYEDVFKNKNRWHNMAHFVFPDYNIVLRIYNKNKKDAIGKYIKSVNTVGYFMYIGEEDTLMSLIERFNKLVEYYKERPKKGFYGKIIKPKRARIKVGTEKSYIKCERVAKKFLQ